MLRPLVLTTTLLIGCGKDSSPEASKTAPAASAAKPPEVAPAASAAALELARKNLPMIEKALAERNSTTAMFECPETLKVLSEVEKGDKALADRIAKLCNHDIYVAEMKAEIEAIEAERAANPKERRLKACYVMAAVTNEKKMKAAGTFDPESQALIEKRALLCADPKAKK